VIDHLAIGKGARVGAKSGVFGDVDAGSVVSGVPSRSHREVLRAQAAMYRLARIVEQLEALVTPPPADGAAS
jgi:UDP-3-O-[3-hydroxymyristoyl] glucosamine N-acyltransferase